MKKFKWKGWVNELLMFLSILNVIIGCNAIELDYVGIAKATTINSLFCIALIVWGNPQIRFWEKECKKWKKQYTH